MADSLFRDLQIEWRDVASLIPDPRNARQHSDSQVAIERWRLLTGGNAEKVA